jgi:hypothetical protein
MIKTASYNFLFDFPYTLVYINVLFMLSLIW